MILIRLEDPLRGPHIGPLNLHTPALHMLVGYKEGHWMDGWI